MKLFRNFMLIMFLKTIRYLIAVNEAHLISRLVAADKMKNDAILLKIKLGSKAAFMC